MSQPFLSECFHLSTHPNGLQSCRFRRSQVCHVDRVYRLRHWRNHPALHIYEVVSICQYVYNTPVYSARIKHPFSPSVGRLIAGLGVGGLSAAVPMYQAETAPPQIRGTNTATYQLFITFGILVACKRYLVIALPNSFLHRIYNQT